MKNVVHERFYYFEIKNLHMFNAHCQRLDPPMSLSIYPIQFKKPCNFSYLGMHQSHDQSENNMIPCKSLLYQPQKLAKPDRTVEAVLSGPGGKRSTLCYC